MTDNEWLTEWLPTPQNVSTRNIWPSPPERAAVATAATCFVEAARQMAESMTSEPGTPAQAAVVIAAVADDYVSTIHEYIDPTTDEEDPYEEEDDSPEAILATHRITAAREAADEMAERAQRMLRQAGMSNSPPKPDPTLPADFQKEREERKRLAKIADSAAALGHSAALNRLLDKMDEPDDADRPELKGAVVLAMWPNDGKIMQLRHHNLTDAARQTLDDTVARLVKNAGGIEEYRPAFVTPLADPQWHDGYGKELLGMFHNMGPEAGAVYHWDNDNTDDAIMAYRHRGSNHVKLVREPYSHGIDRDDALEHCDTLEREALQNRETNDEEPNCAQATRNLLAMAAANRSLILLAYHDVDQEPLDEAVKTAARHDPTRAWQLINVIYDEQAQIVYQKAAALGLNQPDLTAEQIRAAIVAARQAGAGPDAARHMAAILGATPEDADSIGIAEAEPMPWHLVQHIMHNVYQEEAPHDDEKWERITAATGWDHQNPRVKVLRQMLS